jgi:hypothetical protein
MAEDLTLRDFQQALLVRRVVARHVEGKEFTSPEALAEYMKKHPGADKSKHTVVDADTAKLKKELGDFKKIEKGQAKSEKGKAKRKDEKGKKEDDAHAEKLKKELTDWKDAK